MRLPYNYRPTTEEINNAWAILSRAGMPEMTFQVIEHEFGEKIGAISSLIRSMGSFNEKNGERVGAGFGAFFDALPRIYYNEGNPNNGRPLFEAVTLHGDDYILLSAHGFKDNMDTYDWAAVRDLVNETGYGWKADVHELIIEELDYGMVEYTIKFWWD